MTRTYRHFGVFTAALQPDQLLVGGLSCDKDLTVSTMQQSSILGSLTFRLNRECTSANHGGGKEDREEKSGHVEAHDDYRRLR